MFNNFISLQCYCQFTDEISASTPISSRLPVILLLKSSHIPKPKTNIYRRQCCLKSLLQQSTAFFGLINSG